MSKRTIMIFPDFENMEIIDSIRGKYDPLAKLVRPHITLVFPFENEMSNEEIEEILKAWMKSVSFMMFYIKTNSNSLIWGMNIRHTLR